VFIMNVPHPPGEFLRDLTRAGIRGELLGAKGVDELPTMAGAYALILHLAHPVSLTRPRDTINPLAPGWYLYAGSARGPGGIRARLARHFRAEKHTHWHIDQLTGLSDVQIWASPVPEGHECDLVEQFTNLTCFRTACAGFGSTDCRQCEGHLLVWRGE
jgi:Uri superfamily endonuclease